jgi:hypothetical protein
MASRIACFSLLFAAALALFSCDNVDMHEDEWAMVLAGEHGVTLCNLEEYSGSATASLSLEFEESCSTQTTIIVKISSKTGRLETIDDQQCLLYDFGEDACGWMEPDLYHCGPCDFQVSANDHVTRDIFPLDCLSENIAPSCFAKYCCGEGKPANYRLYKYPTQNLE